MVEVKCDMCGRTILDSEYTNSLTFSIPVSYDADGELVSSGRMKTYDLCKHCSDEVENFIIKRSEENKS